MKDEFDFVTIIVAVCVAGYVAMTLDYVAHSELGWSLVQVRGSAVVGALLTTAITLAGMRSGKPGKVHGRS